MSHFDTAVVILNWNGRRFLEQFLPGIISNTTNADIIIVDNASTDDSVVFLSEQYPKLRRLVFKNNIGFAGGYNKAIRELDDYEYIVLLNSDVEIKSNWLDPMITRIKSNNKIGALQPKIKYQLDPQYFEYAGAAGGFIDKYGYPFCRGRIFTELEKDIGQYDDAIPIFWATGACLLVRRSVYLDCGGLDELFFAHMEEIDLCWRMQKSGYEIWYEPKSTVYHIGGGTLGKENPKKTHLNFRNSLLMLWKNLPSNEKRRIIFVRMLLDGLAALQFLLRGNVDNFKAVFQAHISFYKLRQKSSEIGQVKYTLCGYYEKSIVFDFFVRGLKKFSELKISKNPK